MTDLDLQTRPCLHNGEYLGPPILPGDPRGPIPGQGMPDQALDFTEGMYHNTVPVPDVIVSIFNIHFVVGFTVFADIALNSQ